MAGAFAGDRASASAIRWGLAVCFVVGSSALWLRDPLARFATRIGIPTDEGGHLTASLRVVLFGGGNVDMLDEEQFKAAPKAQPRK